MLFCLAIGGCGACVVLLSRYDPLSERVEECSISSCLTLLCSINLCAVTTTEGLGNSNDGFHAIHRRISGFHASQCGFCTPGMCMSIFSALVNADKTTKPEPPSGFSKLSMAEAEKAIAGNICRCTGYRPLVDATKSFSCDVDIEDLGLNAFWSKGENADVEKLPIYSSSGICTFPDFLKTEIRSYSSSTYSSIDSNGAKHSSWELSWCRPCSVSELYDLLSSGQSNKCNVKLVVGNTGSGVYKDTDLYDKYIDLSGIPELSVIKKDSTGIEIGAAVTISKAIEVLKEGNETLVFSKIADHMNKVASHFVRNTASLGGNIIMAQRSHFASDIATILLAAGSSVSIQRVSERLVLTLEEFLEMPPCDQRTLLLSVRIPYWNSVSNSSDGNRHLDYEQSTILFETYRASPRPLGNAVAYLNSAFLAQISFSKNSGDHRLDNLQLAFGAYGCEHAIRARKVEKFLVGKKVTASVLIEAIRLLRATIVPEEGTPNPGYRSSLAVAFLFSFLYPLTNGLTSEYCNGHLNGYVNSTLDSSSNDGLLYHPNHRDLLLSSSQVIGLNKEYFPVGEPTRKAGAELQASGIFPFESFCPSLRL